MPAPDRITAVLGFQKYQVIEFKRVSKEWIELWLEARERNWRCPGCGRRFCVYYDRRWVGLRDLDLASHRTRLVVAKYRVACERCGVRQVATGIARERARCTKRFEKWLFVLTRTMPLSEVAKVMEVDWEAVKDAEVRHIIGLLRKRNLDGIEEIGIDEVSERKGHRYLTLVTDIEGRRVIWVGRGRDRAVLKRFFRWFGKKRIRKLKRVVIDMHDPYEQEIRAQCARIRIIYDHFHLAKPLHLAIDNLRRRLQAELPPEGRKYLKNKRYLLLRGEETLTPKQRVRLRELLKVNEPLNAAYILKEDFRTVFDERDPKKARRALKEWKLRVRDSGIPELMEFVKMLDRRRYGIQNFFRHRLTNGLSEGLNNVVKTVKKVAYGFHDWQYFRLKILRRCGKIEERAN
jgi:transposase